MNGVASAETPRVAVLSASSAPLGKFASIYTVLISLPFSLAGNGLVAERWKNAPLDSAGEDYRLGDRSKPFQNIVLLFACKALFMFASFHQVNSRRKPQIVLLQLTWPQRLRAPHWRCIRPRPRA
jgi:hypothetical protein